MAENNTSQNVESTSCCSAGSFNKMGPEAVSQQVHAGAGREIHSIQQALVPRQTFLMGDVHGDGYRGDGETPIHPVSLDAFMIDSTSVTNADFQKFVDSTGYVTEAEAFGFSAVFHLLLAADDKDVMGQPPLTPWWLGVKGANWKHPHGGNSTIKGLESHPVVHISWNDAMAYCKWAGRSLPTEAQWEAASRGGKEAQRYSWGNRLDLTDDGHWRLNIWQGEFPTHNTLEDGYLATAPVRTFTPNEYGLWQTLGNVWEWCHDFFSPRTYSLDAAKGIVHDPHGPSNGTARILRGGSFLCHESYCNRARNAARWSNTPDSSMSNAGFRTVSNTVSL